MEGSPRLALSFTQSGAYATETSDHLSLSYVLKGNHEHTTTTDSYFFPFFNPTSRLYRKYRRQSLPATVHFSSHIDTPYTTPITMQLLKPLAFAATAAAILIVPDTSEADDGIFRTLPIDVDTFEVPATAFGQSITIPCTRCRDRNAQLELNFNIEEHRLVLNGFELYPHADPWKGDLSAPVTKSNGKSAVRRLGYGLAIRPEGMDDDQHLEVIGVEIRIIEVGDRFVDGVPPVKVKLIKAPVGEIIIGSIEVEGSSHNGLGDDCSMWCRAKGLLHETLKGIKGSIKGKGKGKGCHGMKSHGMKGHGHKNNHGHGNSENKNAGTPHQGHAQLVPERVDYSWANMLKHITAYIIIPVLMGVTAGVGVALYVFILVIVVEILTSCSFAMFLCTLTVRLVRYFKGERPEPALGADYKAAIVEIIAEDEKSGLIVNEEAREA